MTCSRLFSGDFSEITTDIIQNLRNDRKSLYSCILVNRFFCRLIIPLLWEDPFSIKYRENLNCHFLDTYFLFLNDNDKNKLEEIKSYKFNSNSLKPLFNYPSFIKTLNHFRMQLHVVNWLNSTSTSSNQKSFLPLTSIKEESKFTPTDENIQPMNDICIILFKLFIENNASLNNFYITIEFYTQDHLFNHICDMILNNPKFISDIEVFSIDYSCSKTILSLSSLSSSLSTSIKHFDVSYDYDDCEELVKIFANIIQSQSQLSSIKISYFKSLASLLFDSMKYSSNILTSIQFVECEFYDGMRFDALSYLTQLESLQFSNCFGLGLSVIQPLLNITNLKIKTFVLDHYENVIAKDNPIQLLLQKIASRIEYLVLCVYDNELRSKLFEIVIDFCEKIKFLYLGNIDFANIPQLTKMIFNFNNYLKYLSIEIKFYLIYSPSIGRDMRYHDYGLNISLIIFEVLSESLPLSLYYLDLRLVIDPNALEIFFENCKHVKLKKLLIRNRSEKNLVTTLNVIKEFAKEKNLECLAYGVEDIYKPEYEIHHESLESLIEETLSFVNMKNYYDLKVKVSDIDGISYN